MEPQKTPEKRQFVSFLFFKVDPAWHKLSAGVRDSAKKEFEKAVDSFRSQMIILSYSLVGLRAETDFLLWRVAERLGLLQDMARTLLNTRLGQSLSVVHSYLAMTRRSIYVDKHTHPGQEGKRLEIIPGQAKYLFIYPFVKSREWYLLPKEKRQALMDVHIAMGHKYPSVKINTTYSFGLDDQEFVVAFETDSPADFLDLVMELRETETSRYTLRDTPAFTCVAKSLKDTLNDLG